MECLRTQNMEPDSLISWILRTNTVLSHILFGGVFLMTVNDLMICETMGVPKTFTGVAKTSSRGS